MVRMADIVFSHQVSLPSMVCDDDCDTKLPTNLYDDEFNQESKELPSPRPITEATPISYMIAKVKLCIELGNILKATNKVGKGIPYDEILRFDARLRQVMQELPPHLKLGSLAGSREPVTLLIARFNIDILYHKIMCLLHRKYIARARHNPRYAHSRRSAIESSLQAMEHLQTLHRESQDNGRLRTISWYVKSVATKEFIMPAMLIVLDLHYDNMSAQSGLPDDSDGAFQWSAEQRAKMMAALEDASVIWKSLAGGSMEAFKASKTIEIMLQKLRDPASSKFPFSSGSDTLSTPSTGNGFDMPPPAMGQDISPMGFPDFSSGMSPFANTNSSAFMGMELSLPPTNMADFRSEGYSAVGAPSPMSMFTNIGATGAGSDPTTTFDWVRTWIMMQIWIDGIMLTRNARALSKTTHRWPTGVPIRVSRYTEGMDLLSKKIT